MRVNDGGDGGITTMPATDYLPKSSPSTADIQAWNNAIAGTGDGQGGASTPAANMCPAPPPVVSGEKASDDAASHAPSQPKHHKHHWYDRPLGVLQAVGGVGEAVIGTGLLLTPEPTLLTKVAGGAVGLHGLDDIQAGLRTAWSGEQTETVTQQEVTEGAKALGASPGMAMGIGIVVDGGLGMANPEGELGKVARGATELSKAERATQAGDTAAHGAEETANAEKAADTVGDEGKPPLTATGGAGSGKGPIDGGGPHSTVGEPDDPGHLDGPEESQVAHSEASGADGTQKPDPSALKPYRDNPGQLEGKPPAEVEKELDKTLVENGHWTKSPTKDGNGVRYLDGKGGSVIINEGYSDGLQGGGGDAVHQGPYVKIQPGGTRIPLAGNPALGAGS